MVCFDLNLSRLLSGNMVNSSLGVVGAGVVGRGLGLLALCVALTTVCFGARPGRHATEPVRILMIGDSITAGYGLDEIDSLPSQLSACLMESGVQAEMLNAGVSGDTSAGGLARLGWLLKEPIDAVILALGGNDVLRGLPPKATEENLARIIQNLRQQNIPVLLAGMRASTNLGQVYQKQFDAIFPRLAKTYDVLFYPFLLEGVAIRPEYNQPDGIHPNAVGVRIITKNMLPMLLRLIDIAHN